MNQPYQGLEGTFHHLHHMQWQTKEFSYVDCLGGKNQ